ncbi:DUF2802 domain-containing protein [Ectothiorhodospira lacustris]|uniref:DUF2802 domain-containing protein n=1 Tax=Ectothiorhodospira lacustris TaxID=2899127 RepID=UPI001EE8E9AB|nr:DUF2802 domain-containing protein [Ectothiorhodospira lacustris]MCG5511080.1 DUF2802 domain-containing protein [Ectothiorhodospira lacustris]MCG5522912.1 DUF2802 domain-containing protein [Ectothiorhodospira lacustris]
MISYIVLTLALLIALASAAACFWLKRQLDALRKRLSLQETSVLALRGALSALHNEEQQFEAYRKTVDQQLRRLAEQQEQVLMRDVDEGPYRQAMRMVRQGATRDDLVAGCGLSSGEAELLLAMHRDHSVS